MDFEITDEPVDDVTHVVAPRGELDMAVAGQLKARLVELIDSGNASSSSTSSRSASSTRRRSPCCSPRSAGRSARVAG